MIKIDRFIFHQWQKLTLQIRKWTQTLAIFSSKNIQKQQICIFMNAVDHMKIFFIHIKLTPEKNQNLNNLLDRRKQFNCYN